MLLSLCPGRDLIFLRSPWAGGAEVRGGEEEDKPFLLLKGRLIKRNKWNIKIKLQMQAKANIPHSWRMSCDGISITTVYALKFFSIHSEGWEK